MFDVNATRSWWNFFHRFSYLLNISRNQSNFDYILILGINLLQCHTCQEDAGQFIRTIGDHKSPFEKMHILHNYVNRKLNKPIFEITEAKKLISDVVTIDPITGEEQPNWTKFINYYFDLLFLIVKYVDEKQLADLKEFSAYIYRSIDLPKRSRGLAINVEYTGKYNPELIKMQIYEYYRNVINSLNLGRTFKALTPAITDRATSNLSDPENLISSATHPLKTYQEIYGNMPKINKTCKSCAKRHALYLESHNTIARTTTTEPKIVNKIVTPIKDIPQTENQPVPATIQPPKSSIKQGIPTPKTKTESITLKKSPSAPQKTTVINDKIVPALVKLPVRLQKPMKRTMQEIIVQRSEDKINSTAIRKKVVTITPKAKKAIGVRGDKRKIIFQSSRIIRYQQNRVVSSSK
jgi:hypothetical protein